MNETWIELVGCIMHAHNIRQGLSCHTEAVHCNQCQLTWKTKRYHKGHGAEVEIRVEVKTLVGQRVKWAIGGVGWSPYGGQLTNNYVQHA